MNHRAWKGQKAGLVAARQSPDSFQVHTTGLLFSQQECTGVLVQGAWGSAVSQGCLCPAFVVMGCDLSPQSTGEAGGEHGNAPLGCGDIQGCI